MGVQESVHTHLPTLREIANANIGQGWLTEADFRRLLETGGPEFLTIAYETASGDIQFVRTSLDPDRGLLRSDTEPLGRRPCGFVIGGVYFSPDHASSQLQAPPREFPVEVETASKPGVISYMAIGEPADEEEVARALVGDALRVMEVNQCDVITGIVNKRSQDTLFESALEEHGFESKAELHHYWGEMTRTRGYSCAVCGHPPCTCSAEVYLTYPE